jgi:hypothetical protein
MSFLLDFKLIKTLTRKEKDYQVGLFAEGFNFIKQKSSPDKIR